MAKINNLTLHLCSIYVSLFYFTYVVILTLYDVSNLKKIEWKQAFNQTTVYSSRRSTTITYIFEKEGVRVSRKYPCLIEGFNTWLWGIDKRKNREDISFYIRNKDYEKIRNNQIPYEHDFWGNIYSKKETIPFFGLREINFDSNKILLALDIWKYNYSIILSLFIILSPYLMISITSWGLKKNIKVSENVELQKKIGKYIIIYFIIFFLNLII